MSVRPLGFALFIRPGVDSSYWTALLPAIVVLGLGMAISVAPLTTIVMSAVPQNRVGIASGINNAISRAAGLLAIAILGIVMLHVFNHSLDRQLSDLALPASIQQSLDNQRINLAATTVPEQIPLSLRLVVRRAINESFVDGFRRVMLVGAALALASSITSLLLITGRAKPVQF